MKKYTAIMLAVIMVFCLSVSVLAADTDKSGSLVLSVQTPPSIAITGFVEPAAGEMPVLEDDLSVPEDADYEVTMVQWFEREKNSSTAYQMSTESGSSAFQPDKVYYAWIFVELLDTIGDSTIASNTVFTLNGGQTLIAEEDGVYISENGKAAKITTKEFALPPVPTYTISIPSNTALTYGSTDMQSIGNVGVYSVKLCPSLSVKIENTPLTNTADATDTLPLSLSYTRKAEWYKEVHPVEDELIDVYLYTVYNEGETELDYSIELYASVSSWEDATPNATYQSTVTFNFQYKPGSYIPTA